MLNSPVEDVYNFKAMPRCLYMSMVHIVTTVFVVIASQQKKQRTIILSTITLPCVYVYFICKQCSESGIIIDDATLK